MIVTKETYDRYKTVKFELIVYTQEQGYPTLQLVIET